MEPEVTSDGVIDRIAVACGTTAPAVRLLISILLGYPLAVIYRTKIYNQSPTVQHVFFAVTGIGICFWNFGTSTFHCLGCVPVLYILLLLQGGKVFSIAFAFVYFMGYLLVGYILTETDTYDIKWTMPHCVLTLRAIALVFDVYDGKRPPEHLSPEQKLNALSEIPSMLEIAGCFFFFGGCLVGPQFSFKRYKDFVNKKLIPHPGRPDSVRASLIRGFAAITYLILFIVASSYLPLDYLLSDPFKAHSILNKYFLLGLWGKVHCMKYIISWMLSESTCMMTGITYNGDDSTCNERWDAFSNVDLVRYETVTKFAHVIESFNIQTNKWAAMYIYKRLRFLGSRFISQCCTLGFLAVWHGFHLTYYLVFALEVFVMKFERDVEAIVSQNRSLNSFLNKPGYRQIKQTLQRLYVFVFMGYCLLPFIIISWEKTNEAYAELYFVGHFLYFGWPIFHPFIKKYLVSSPHQGRTYENGFLNDKTD